MSSRYAQLESRRPILRMVVVGRTGAGKSETGNTILRRKAFESGFSSSAVTSKCQKGGGEFDGILLTVVDTPGLFDTSISQEEATKEIASCISFLAPGPHAFLVVIKLGRFTKEEQDSITIIQNIFGEQAARYTTILFTHGDVLQAEGIDKEEFIYKNKVLREFISQCNGGYHVFNNRNQDPSQVGELLEKINTMVQRTGGEFYTCEMLEVAERCIQREMEQFQTEEPGMRPKEARRWAERSNELIRAVAATLGASVVGIVGVAIGSVVGPVGAAVGGAVGASVGLTVAGITAAVKNRNCIIQ